MGDVHVFAKPVKPRTVTVFYKCKCMEKERPVTMAERVEGTDIVLWMSLVLEPTVAYDHSTVSPRCREARMEYVKVPMGDNGEAGREVTKN